MLTRANSATGAAAPPRCFPLRKFAVAVILAVVWASPATALQWMKLENCTFVANYYNDADSFHVLHDGKEYIFRLYFVDAPETEVYLKQRVLQQAENFGIAYDKMLQVGHDASAFVSQQLANGFTVLTKWHGAQGRSAMPRYYALVRVGDQDLGEMLIKNGLARLYGVRVNSPEGESSGSIHARMLTLQENAHKSHVGAWQYTADVRLAAGEDAPDPLAGLPSIICPRKVPAYSMGMPRERLGVIAGKTRVHILEEYPDGWVHVRYSSEDGEPMNVLCLRWDLSLPDRQPTSE